MQIARLADILLGAGHLRGFVHNCLPSPGVRITLARGEHRAEVLICFG